MGYGHLNRPRLAPRLLVFDLDGTLVDSKDDIADALNAALGAIGHPPLPIGLIGAFVGNGVGPLIARTVAAAGRPEEKDRLLALFRDIYERNLLVKTTLFPGVAETLDVFQGRYPMGLITNKPERFTLPIVEGLNLAPHFGDRVYSGDTLPVSKPDPTSLLRIAASYGVAPRDTLIVGDSAVDVMTGKNAGAMTVGVSYGFRDVAELTEAGADAVIDRFDELPSLLEDVA